MNISIVGASGAVGQELLSLLEERAFPVDELRLFGSSRSAGRTYLFRGQEVTVEELREESSFEGVDIAFTSAGAGTAKTYAATITRYGTIMIDNSSAFRQVDGIPLVVPEVNAEDAVNGVLSGTRIIANPNCTTILMTVVLQPIHQLSAIRSIHVASYQSASGAGAQGMAELKQQYTDLVTTGTVTEIRKFPVQLAYNVIPQVDIFLDNDYTKEEMKMYHETRKIMHADISCSATCVRVPTLRAHAEAIWLVQDDAVAIETIQDALSVAPGVTLIRDNHSYPTPLLAASKDDVYVGRIRRDLANDRGISLWLTGDQIRKGAALNAIQIAEVLVDKGVIPARG